MPQLIPPQELYSLLLWFAPCFTAPSFAYFVSFVVCLMVNLGRGTTTLAYRTSPGDRHWTNYCRFLSKRCYAASKQRASPTKSFRHS